MEIWKQNEISKNSNRTPDEHDCSGVAEIKVTFNASVAVAGIQKEQMENFLVYCNEIQILPKVCGFQEITYSNQEVKTRK